MENSVRLFTLEKERENVAYNILDLISKNLFGVFMVYLILVDNEQTYWFLDAMFDYFILDLILKTIVIFYLTC